MGIVKLDLIFPIQDILGQYRAVLGDTKGKKFSV
jgi:hypothetical protein